MDFSTGEIRKAGMRVRLAGQPFRLLAALLARPGEILSREELQHEIWGANTNVDFERGIASAINKVREALGDSADHPLYIETLARRGYRFIAPVTVETDNPHAPAAELRPREPVETLSTPKTGLDAYPGAGLEVVPEPMNVPGEHRPLARDTTLDIPEWSRASSGSPLTFPAAPDATLPTRAAAPRPLPRWLALAALAIAALSSLGTYFALHEAQPVTPARIEQLTNDGSIYAGPPNAETILTLETDGPRIYAPTLVDGRSQITSLDTGGSQMEPVKMPDELGAGVLTDISHDGSELLVRNLRNRAAEQPLWVVPTSGAGAIRIGEVLAHDAVWMPGENNSILYAAGDELSVLSLGTETASPYASLPGRAFWLRWSPDGRTLRFTLLDPVTHTSSLWELDAADRHPRPLRFPGLEKASLCCGSWTPSGDLFVFQASDARSSNLWAERGVGAHDAPIQLTNGPLRFASPLPGRESRTVYAFGSSEPSGARILDRQKNMFVPAPHFLSQAQRVSYSRDGAWVAWTDVSGRLWRARSSDGSGLLRLTGDDFEVYLARWSPDGQELLLMARKPGETWKVEEVRAEGGAVHTVLSDNRNLADPDWSADGQHIVFGREADLMGKENGAQDIEVLDLRTQKISAIPGSQDLFSPRWSPDGRFIAALSRDQTRLAVFDCATHTWRTLFTGGAADPVWSTDSTALYFHAFERADSAIMRVSLQEVGQPAHGKTSPESAPVPAQPVADLFKVGLPSIDNFFFSGLTPGNLPLIKPRVGTGNLYAITLPASR
ncbi:winged helix-turn-helix domain-containing protein [Acidipila sp. EB88]|uniref:winged helix-turn-helix domain-containing protein n=1 Tax=Acidipila sp. EB88 TaxID=2305226 RepID=UPI0013157495|nr:winged helix-turn-helix domain-containing protein [Acidipila sp. EB88]